MSAIFNPGGGGRDTETALREAVDRHNAATRESTPLPPPPGSGQDTELLKATEAALRDAINQHKLDEHRSLNALSSAVPSTAKLSELLSSHASQQRAQMQQQEEQINRVREFLTRQLTDQKNQILKTKHLHDQQLYELNKENNEALTRCHIRAMPQNEKDEEIRRLTVNHSNMVMNLRAHQAKELSELEKQLIDFMQIQEEELDRVRKLHQQQMRLQQQAHEVELKEFQTRMAKQGHDVHKLEADIQIMRQNAIARDEEYLKINQTVFAEKGYRDVEQQRRYDQLASGTADLRSQVNENIRMLRQHIDSQAAAAQNLITGSAQDLTRMQNLTATRVQHLQDNAVSMRREQNDEMARMREAQATKQREYELALLKLRQAQMEQANDVLTAKETIQKKAALQEEEIRRIKERTEEEFQSRLKLQQVYAQEKDLMTKLAAQERHMAVSMMQFENEITNKELEIQQIKNELCRRDQDYLIQSEELKHKDMLLTERDMVLPQLQEKLYQKERELSSMISEYHTTKLEMQRSLEEVKADLYAEGQKARIMKEQIEDLSNMLSEKNAKLTALQNDLENEKVKTYEAISAAEALKPEIHHWRMATEANSNTRKVLEEQMRVVQEVNQREIRLRDDTIGKLRQESDEMRQTIAHLTESLAQTQQQVKASQNKEVTQASRIEMLANKVRDAESELIFATQALEAVSNRNQELESLHMKKIVSALDDHIFKRDLELPQQPLHAMSVLDPSIDPRPPTQQEEQMFAPVVDTLARYIKGTRI
eukprot:TRINITY_DN5457_c0_g1_i1.p1 TRINITY_DN5457_c0_g1~~TRINITY_DN5457_c0_g1_i1.p1  ORF type:complete len:791 (+),score=324.00 TRINITY_DN5457_c0_g1_i1:68-2374(+)